MPKFGKDIGGTTTLLYEEAIEGIENDRIPSSSLAGGVRVCRNNG